MQHIIKPTKLVGVVVVVDLHATEINQFLTFCTGALELRFGFTETGGKVGPALNVEGVGLQASSATSFGQSNRIKNADGDVVFTGGLDNFPLTRTGCRMCGFRKLDQAKYRYQKKCRYCCRSCCCGLIHGLCHPHWIVARAAAQSRIHPGFPRRHAADHRLSDEHLR